MHSDSEQENGFLSRPKKGSQKSPEGSNPENVIGADAQVNIDEDIKPSAVPKLKGHKAREAKRKAREEGAKTAKKEDNEQEANSCATCGSVFSSRNKMFDHLKRTGHAQYIGNSKGGKVRR